VGLIFLFIPDKVLVFFNNLSSYLGMPLSSVEAFDFYLILAVGYMYLVALLAFLMYRHPENKYFPLLLANGKIASSILSLLLFVIHQPYMIYITNCLIDGLIGIVVLAFYLKLKRERT
jgi:hypothetical protein